MSTTEPTDEMVEAAYAENDRHEAVEVRRVEEADEVTLIWTCSCGERVHGKYAHHLVQVALRAALAVAQQVTEDDREWEPSEADIEQARVALDRQALMHILDPNALEPDMYPWPGNTADAILAEGFRRSPVAPSEDALPTEPGIYVASRGGRWELDAEGQWWFRGYADRPHPTPDQQNRTEFDVRTYGMPLVRVVAPSEDVAKLIERVESHIDSVDYHATEQEVVYYNDLLALLAALRSGAAVPWGWAA